MIKKISTATIYVEDQNKSIDFWIKKIGFEVKVDIDMGNGFRWVEIAPKGAESHIVIYPKKLMANWKEFKPSLVFNCDKIETFCKDLKKKGVVFAKELSEMPWGKFASFRDLDGNEFLLKG